MIEPYAHAYAFGRRLAEQRAGVFHVLAIGQRPRGQRQARADRLFVGWMHVVRIANIDGHGHRRIGHEAMRRCASRMAAQASLHPI